MDIVGRISNDLENEGVKLSNSKILKILQALKSLVKAYYKLYVKMSSVPQEGEAPDFAAEIDERMIT